MQAVCDHRMGFTTYYMISDCQKLELILAGYRLIGDSQQTCRMIESALLLHNWFTDFSDNSKIIQDHEE
jgi:hypothetical protein